MASAGNPLFARENPCGGHRARNISRLLRACAFASVLGLGAIADAQIACAQMPLPGVELSPIVVTPPAKPPQTQETEAYGRVPVTMTTAGPVRGYQALTATTATRTATPIEQIPQSIDVVPRSVIDDQQTLTISEALQNVSGVSGIPPLFPYGVAYKIRGFQAERYIDGLSNYNDAGDYTTLINTERIEVIKGPGGLFYQGGLGVLGGMINTVSKLPTAVPQYQAGLTSGSFGLVNPWFDVNHPLASVVLFRMTGEFAKSQNYIELIEPRRWSLYPTLTFSDGDTTLTVQGNVTRRESRSYVGLPGTGTLDTSEFTVRGDLSVGDPKLPTTTSQGHGLTARLDRQLSDVWSLQVPMRYSEAHVNERAQVYFFNKPDVPPSQFALLNWHLVDDSRDFTAAPNLVGKFTAGPMSNTLLLGVDYDRTSAPVSTWGSFAGLADLSNPHPTFPPYSDPLGTGTLFFNASNIYVNSGAIAQLQSTLFDRLHLLAGVRWAYVDVQNNNPTVAAFPGAPYHAVNRKALPRVGAAFDLLPGVALFSGYSEGMRGVRFFSGTGTPQPEESVQIEGGVKLSLPFGLAGTMAVFDVRRRNVPTGDPAQPFLQVQAGEERSKGFDFDLTWQPSRELSILASFAHVDARVTQDIFFPVGNRVDFVPENSGRLWAMYKFQSGQFRNLSIGAGLYAAGRQALNLDNQFFTPGFVTFDARIAYDFKNYTFAVTGKNLTDRRYFIPYPYFSGRVAPGDPLTVLASISVKY